MRPTRRFSRKLGVTVGAAVLLVGAVLASSVVSARARWREGADLSGGEPTRNLVVPYRSGALDIDGAFEDPAWQEPTGRTGAFRGENGEAVHPHSEARFIWDEENLYLLLYAADENIQSNLTASDDPVWLDDSFHLELTNGEDEYSFDISAAGILADGKRGAGRPPKHAARPFDLTWKSTARIARDVDGTINDPGDDDEEWVLEAAIPLRKLGLRGREGEHLAFTVQRCDTPKATGRVCGAWPGEHSRGMLVLGRR